MAPSATARGSPNSTPSTAWGRPTAATATAGSEEHRELPLARVRARVGGPRVALGEVG